MLNIVHYYSSGQVIPHLPFLGRCSQTGRRSVPGPSARSSHYHITNRRGRGRRRLGCGWRVRHDIQLATVATYWSVRVIENTRSWGISTGDNSARTCFPFSCHPNISIVRDVWKGSHSVVAIKVCFLPGFELFIQVPELLEV